MGIGITDDSGMEIRGLAADLMRERERLRIENHTLKTVIDACSAKQREDALVHIRLRAALREAVEAIHAHDYGRGVCDDNVTSDEQMCEWRGLVTP